MPNEKKNTLVSNITIYISFWLCRKITVMILWFGRWVFFLISVVLFMTLSLSFAPVFAEFLLKQKQVQVCDFYSLIFKWLWTAFWFVFIRRKVFCDSFFLLFWSLPRIEFIPSLFVLMLSIFFGLLCVSLIKCDAILFPVCRFTFVDSPRSIFGAS